jgi:hypothetical protein
VAPAPTLGGVRLGGTVREVRARLGAPDRTQEAIGLRFWNYEDRGLTVIWREGEPGVHGIVATRAAAGDVRRIRVGDSESALRREWGTPARERQSGRFLDYVGADWVLSVEVRSGAIVEMTLVRTRADPP